MNNKEVMKKELNKIMDKYPAAAYKSRKGHTLVVDKSEVPQEIVADCRTIPGIITERGCSYAGCKGVVVGPLKDTVAITRLLQLAYKKKQGKKK